MWTRNSVSATDSRTSPHPSASSSLPTIRPGPAARLPPLRSGPSQFAVASRLLGVTNWPALMMSNKQECGDELHLPRSSASNPPARPAEPMATPASPNEPTRGRAERARPTIGPQPTTSLLARLAPKMTPMIRGRPVLAAIKLPPLTRRSASWARFRQLAQHSAASIPVQRLPRDQPAVGKQSRDALAIRSNPSVRASSPSLVVGVIERSHTNERRLISIGQDERACSRGIPPEE